MTDHWQWINIFWCSLQWYVIITACSVALLQAILWTWCSTSAVLVKRNKKCLIILHTMRYIKWFYSLRFLIINNARAVNLSTRNVSMWPTKSPAENAASKTGWGQLRRQLGTGDGASSLLISPYNDSCTYGAEYFRRWENISLDVFYFFLWEKQ